MKSVKTLRNFFSFGGPKSHEEFSDLDWSRIPDDSSSKNLDILAFFWNPMGCPTVYKRPSIASQFLAIDTAFDLA